LPLQSRLLRVLQEREVVRLGATEPTRIDIRIVAATHRSLAEAIDAGAFRADLYYRLNILSIALPPLRERTEDIVPLATQLLLQAAQREPRLANRVRGSEAAERLIADIGQSLCRYGWPGNVRELQNVVERIAVELADADGPDAMLEPLASEAMRAIVPELFVRARRGEVETRTLRERSRHIEADEVRAALAACGGDREAACAMLGISKTTLWRKLSVVPRPDDSAD
jgi:propionate catabolism operon transcriptional regulator